MPLIAFRPTKARLVLERGHENMLVMKVLVAAGETVALATGGALESISGLMRIRERKDETGRGDDDAVGSLVYADAVVEGQRRRPASFQVDIALSSAQFDVLFSVAVSGRLPSKMFVQAGERVSGKETRGLVYLMRGATRVKFWNNRRNPTLPVTNFSVILPIDIPGPAESMEPADVGEPLEPAEPMESDVFDEEQASADSFAGSVRMADLADEFAVFRGETKNTLTALVSVVAVLGILLLVINLVLILK
jgi:hypothetical protein